MSIHNLYMNTDTGIVDCPMSMHLYSLQYSYTCCTCRTRHLPNDESKLIGTIEFSPKPQVEILYLSESAKLNGLIVSLAMESI